MACTRRILGSGRERLSVRADQSYIAARHISVWDVSRMTISYFRQEKFVLGSDPDIGSAFPQRIDIPIQSFRDFEGADLPVMLDSGSGTQNSADVRQT